MTLWWQALRSGWYAGLRQFRSMRTRQRNARRIADPLQEQT